jgi:hypothetical protein
MAPKGHAPLTRLGEGGSFASVLYASGGSFFPRLTGRTSSSSRERVGRSNVLPVSCGLAKTSSSCTLFLMYSAIVCLVNPWVRMVSGLSGVSHDTPSKTQAPSGVPRITATLRPSLCLPFSHCCCRGDNSFSILTNAFLGRIDNHLYSTHRSSRVPEYQISAVPPR